MNKLTIPAILTATIMVAGMFAFMPVEQASTVHLSAAGASTQLKTVTAAAVLGAVIDGGTVTTLTCPGGCVVKDITVTIVNDTGDEEVNITADTITVDGNIINHEVFDVVAGLDTTDLSLFQTGVGATNIFDSAVGVVPEIVVEDTMALTWTDIAGTYTATDSLLVKFIIEETADVTATAATAG